MKQYITKVASICFFHLCRQWQVRHRVGKDITIRLVMVVITSRLVYCNLVLAGLPSQHSSHFNSPECRTAHLRRSTSRTHHSSSVRAALASGSLKSQVQAVLDDVQHAQWSLPFISVRRDAVCRCTIMSTHLRSADSSSYVKPRLRIKFGERVFSYSGPAARNQLPDHTRQLSSLSAFMQELKTVLFSRSFSSHTYIVMHLCSSL